MDYKLTNPQNSILLTEEFYSNTAINNIGGYTYISEKVNFEFLTKAINKVIETNDSMRIKLKKKEDLYYQYFSNFEKTDIDIINLNSKEEIYNKSLDFSKVPFNINNNKLFKFILFRLPDRTGGFFLVAHHLIGDSWGLGLIVKEIMNTYSSFVNNYRKEFSSFSYTQYINDEQNYLKSDRFNKDKEYWNNKFQTVPTSITLPSLKKATTISPNGNRINCKISEDILLKINNFCKENRVSIYNFFMAIYSIYFGKLTNTDDFVIGTPILNRTNFEQKHTAGMFINTAPLRINLNNNLNFNDYVKEIAINTLSLFKHQRYPYQYMLEDLRKKDSSIPNLYNILLSYQITKTYDDEAGIKYTAEWLNNGCCADDLQIHIFDLNDGNAFTIAYDYKIDKYDEIDIKNLNSRITEVINQALDNPQIVLKNIEIVTPEEEYKILNVFNNTEKDYDKTKTIVNLFEEQVEKTPNNIAVVFEDEKLTYKELNEKANELAHYLINKDVGTGDIIGILFKRSIEIIISILAVLKTGAAYLPLDPNYPQERIKYILNASKTKYILTNTSFKFNNSEIIYNQNIELFRSFEKTNLGINIPKDSMSYLIYTSGSTGNPKGVSLNHLALTNLAYYCNNYIEYLKDNSKYISIASITTVSFDIFIFESLISLQKGLKVVLANVKEQTSVKALNELIKRENVEAIQSTPSRMQVFLNNLEDLPYLKNLKYITLAGEQLPVTLSHKLHSLSGATIYNGYGPSETTVFATLTDVTSKKDQMTIGKPLQNTQILILNNEQKLCPVGVVGEIYISGDNIGLGYYNNKDLTSKSFVVNPYSKDNSLMYKSGDLGYYTNDGELVCLGRIDHQVKIRGLRIELEEIEKKLLLIDSIKNCVVTKIINNSGAECLCAYLLTDSSIDTAVIKKHLSSNLPNYMVPEYYVKMDKFPYTPNGKIDRKNLPTPEFNINKTCIPPRNSIDKSILKCVKELLKTENISISDSFFSLGGDSLSAISFSNKLSSVLELDIAVKDIFTYPILSNLSDYISTLKTNKEKSIVAASNPLPYYSLSSAQKRVYYSCKLDKSSTLYNMPGGVILDDTVDIKKLEKCFNILIARHTSLRTYFEIVGDEVIQKTNNNIYINLKLECTEEQDLNKIFISFVKPFDLANSPLFRVKLVNLNNGKILFLFDMHHIIGDGISLKILLEELSSLYNGLSLTNKNIDYTDFILWEQKQHASPEYIKSKEYWITKFNDEIPLLNMPTVFERSASKSFEGANYYTKLDQDIFNKINLVANKLNVTPYVLLLSVYYILLSKYTSQDDIVVGSPMVGRNISELSNIIGMFVNTLALRNKIDSSLSFDSFCNSVKTNCLSSFEHQEYQYDELINDLNIKRDPSRNPLFDVMFVFQNEGYPKLELNGIHSEYFVPSNNISKFDITLEIMPVDNRYSIRFEYATDLFNENFIQKFSDHYINVLNKILDDPLIQINRINMLSEDEKNQILYDFNNTKTDYPKDKNIIDLFELQVNKIPNNIAVIFENDKLTYKELNEKSNQLARFLMANNVGLGDVVGIFLDKSLEMIVSILGILKVGATFLPIDISYPNERIDYILRDSKADILLTVQDYIHKANDTVQPLCVDLDSPIFYQYDNTNININYDSDTLAYVMYTSGSTGTPKGVMVTHKNIIRLVKNNEFISFDKDEHILQTGSIVFDACTFEIWSALLNGFDLYIIKKEDLLDAVKLEEYLNRNNITTLWLTAPLFNQLSESKPDMFKSVIKLLTGGDVLSPKHINAVKKACPNLTIINGYGPTENTTFSCCFTIDTLYKNSIPIGKPISNSTAYIMSKDADLLPIGIPGELWVGGDGVSNGYLNNTELTSEKFIDNPFGKGKIYKTGDLVKWLPNGNIEFIGRIDNQVKIRGFRIELSEINNQILSHPLIKEAFTVVNNINNSKQICSYIVTQNNFDLEELKSYLKLYLPNYMLPSYYIKLKKLPMNPNGKVDKKALPTKIQSFIDGKTIKEATTDDEKLLLSLFKKVLNNDNIGIYDSFFEVGGDSLTAMRLQVEAISNNLNISYSDIFKFTSVENILKNLEKSNTGSISNLEDYKKYDNLLINNSLENEIVCNPCAVGNVLLTGFTGFLGAHVLDSFIKKETGKIYCLIRSKNNMSAKERLYNVLHFYFDTKYDELVDKQIFVVEGDISEKQLGLSDSYYLELGKNINTVIHSAALVKHYGVYSDFEKINVIGTKNIVDFSLSFDLKLLHISTISVSGNNLAEGSNISNNFETEKDFDESNFYIGQNLENLYVKSKFEAEKIVLDAIKKGLLASILRMGNLTSRFSEGKFQQNHFENAFVNRFKSFLQIGIFPKSLLNLYCEFTPIDYCGDAIIDIASHFNKDYTVFHLLNEKQVNLDRLFDMLQELGIYTKLVSDEDFAITIQKILQDNNKKTFLEGIINDLTSDKKLVYKSDVNIKSDFTKEFLYKAGFEWPYIDINYIRNYLKYLIDIGYFNIEIN